MLENLKSQPADKIIMLSGMFNADPRSDKIDLGVGVYKDASSVTPVMRAIKTAEQQLWQDQTTKAYVGLAGDPAFADAMRGLILGDAVDRDRIAAAATPGGTGAVRQALELVKLESPNATIWLSAPTWPNHPSIVNYLGLNLREYRYFDPDSRAVDFPGMMSDLEDVQPGDVVLLHGCCHNPTGANLNLTEWQVVADHLNAKAAIPMVDIAYQGFGDGLTEDAAGTQLIARQCPEVLIAASCSKNFGIYRERTGLLLAIAPNADAKPLAQGMLAYLNRQNYSFPPDHGARLVTMILNDTALRADWQTELEAMRSGMLGIRQQLADELQRLTGSDRFGYLAQHRGMFSRLGATPEQVETLRDVHGIYMVGDSRMNIAGLNAQSVPILAKAIVDVGI